MKFRMKYLLFFSLIFIVNGKPFNLADYSSLYNNRILKPNYEGFVNTVHVQNSYENVPFVYYNNIINRNMMKQGINYANHDVNEGGILHAVQDAGTKNNRRFIDNRNEIHEPSENTFYDINELYTPLVNIYRSYPVDLYQQQQLNGIEHYLLEPEQSRVLDAFFTIESLPFLNPLILLSEPSPSHQQQHSSVNIPTKNLRRFSMPAFPPFRNNFPSFPKMNFGFSDVNAFNNQFDIKRLLPKAFQDSIKNQNGHAPDLIQYGSNNKNIKSGNQNGIVQISFNRKSTMPIITTTEFPDTDGTTTLSDETTTFLDG
ncbi:uncharacterized protein [Chironomus tepperi]|uniref:uncharacterized protein n=1 Tax=Chironomus tepperi TaxID=113505 RepID=UPI00391EF3C6